MRIVVVRKHNLAAILHVLHNRFCTLNILRAFRAVVTIIQQPQVSRRFIHLVHDAENMTIAGRVLAARLQRQLAQLYILCLLRIIHVDHVRNILASWQLQPDIISRLTANASLHCRAQLFHVFESSCDRRFFHHTAGRNSHTLLKLRKPIDKFFAIPDTDVFHQLRCDVRHHGVNFQRAIFNRRSSQTEYVLSAIFTQQPARFHVEVQRTR